MCIVRRESRAGGTRTHKSLRPADFKSAASANSATAPQKRNDETRCVEIEMIAVPDRNVKIDAGRKKNAGTGPALGRGDGGIRTRDGGFADLCLNHLATSPYLTADILRYLRCHCQNNRPWRVRFKMGALFAFLADSSRALQACGQGTASAVQVAGGRPWALSEHLSTSPLPAPLNKLPQN